jgi:hypothetical protein
MAGVDYNRENYNMCLCGGCPVNRSSSCVAQQEEAISHLFEQIEKDSKMPDAESMPGIYCATGKSDCDDLGVVKSCLCPACPVSIENELSNSYYCLKGSAEEVG